MQKKHAKPLASCGRTDSRRSEHADHHSRGEQPSTERTEVDEIDVHKASCLKLGVLASSLVFFMLSFNVSLVSALSLYQSISIQ